MHTQHTNNIKFVMQDTISTAVVCSILYIYATHVYVLFVWCRRCVFFVSIPFTVVTPTQRVRIEKHIYIYIDTIPSKHRKRHLKICWKSLSPSRF